MDWAFSEFFFPDILWNSFKDLIQVLNMQPSQTKENPVCLFSLFCYWEYHLDTAQGCLSLCALLLALFKKNKKKLF